VAVWGSGLGWNANFWVSQRGGPSGPSGGPQLPLPTGASLGLRSVEKLVPLRVQLEGTMKKIGMALGTLQNQGRWPDVLGHLSATAASLEDALQEVDEAESDTLLVYPIKLCANPAVCTSMFGSELVIIVQMGLWRGREEWGRSVPRHHRVASVVYRSVCSAGSATHPTGA
jgi:hypothetical protein